MGHPLRSSKASYELCSIPALLALEPACDGSLCAGLPCSQLYVKAREKMDMGAHLHCEHQQAEAERLRVQCQLGCIFRSCLKKKKKCVLGGGSFSRWV